MKMGYILIIIGMAFIGWGVVVINRQNKDKIAVPLHAASRPKQLSEQPLSIVINGESNEKKQEVEVKHHEEVSEKENVSVTSAKNQHVPSPKEEKTSKEKGNDFEAYMADILKGSKIRIKEWNQGTITDNGAMGENALNPDFFVEQKYGDNGKVEYWIECKWRSKIAQEFSLEEYQTARYRKIQRETKRKIILAIGIGGTPDAPKSVYFVPLNNLTENSISREEMKKFYLSNPHRDFRNRIDRYFREEVFR